MSPLNLVRLGVCSAHTALPQLGTLQTWTGLPGLPAPAPPCPGHMARSEGWREGSAYVLGALGFSNR